jgi:hypothetical protein
VDNWARVNFGMPKDFEQKKGLYEGPLLVDGAQLSNLTAIPLELKSKWIKRYGDSSIFIIIIIIYR